jgi:transcriptional regulator with XRE-family HTH domain
MPDGARAFKLALLDRRLSQRDLATCAHIDYTRLHRLVYGDTAPTDRERDDICRILGVEADVLFPPAAVSTP